MTQEPFDVEKLRASGEAEERLVGLVEGLCDVAIDIRSSITCCLSAEDNEWSYGDEIIRDAKSYRRVLAIAKRYAESACGDPDGLVWELMAKAARKANQPAILPW